MPMSDKTLVYRFARLARNILNKHTVSNREYIGFFGTMPIVMAKLWELIVENNEDDGKLEKGAKYEHLRWALHYLKQYPKRDVMTKTMMKKNERPPTRKTLTKWINYFIEELHALEEGPGSHSVGKPPSE